MLIANGMSHGHIRSCSRYTAGFMFSFLGSAVSSQSVSRDTANETVIYVAKSNDFFQLSTSRIIYFSKYIERPFPMRQDAKRILPERQRENESEKRNWWPNMQRLSEPQAR